MTAIKIFLIAIFASYSTAVQAKKSNYPFEQLVGLADLIVTGQISNVLGDSCYVFAIDQTVKGETRKEIMVKVFANWSCDVRWKKPEVGQKLFLFLFKKLNVYESINGSDGEIFIIDNKLRLFNPFNPVVSRHFNDLNSPQLNDVIISIKNFMACYSFNGVNSYPFMFSQTKTDDEIQSFKKINSFSIWLFDRIKEYKISPQSKTTANMGYFIGRRSFAV